MIGEVDVDSQNQMPRQYFTESWKPNTNDSAMRRICDLKIQMCKKRLVTFLTAKVVTVRKLARIRMTMRSVEKKSWCPGLEASAGSLPNVGRSRTDPTPTHHRPAGLPGPGCPKKSLKRHKIQPPIKLPGLPGLCCQTIISE